MAIQCTTALAQNLSRTTRNPRVTAFTMMAWASYQGNGFSALLAMSLNGTNQYLLGIGVAQPALYTATSGVVNSAKSMPLNTWHHQTMQCTGTGVGNLLTYFDGVADITGTADATTSNATMEFCDDPGADPASCSVCEIKVWDRILTPGEIAIEMRTIGPVSLARLNGYYPCTSVADCRLDYSGNANHLTVAGTFASVSSNPRAVRPMPLLQGPIRVFKTPTAGGFTPLFRKTLSGTGNHVGGRQVHGWG